MPVEYRTEGFYQHQSTPQQIIAGSYVKLNRMQEITFEAFADTSIATATELNVFIDLYAVLHSIFSENHHVIIDDPMAITSSIINMCGHYRNFFKQLRVSTKFYLVFSLNTCEINRKMVAGYNEKFYQKTQIKQFRDIVDRNIDILNLLCKYIPGVYFIKSSVNFESSVIIADLIERLNRENGRYIPNLIISKDILPMQLTAIYPYTSYLKPIKYKGQDNSIMTPISEAIIRYRRAIWSIITDVKKTKNVDMYNLSPINLPLLFAISSFPQRNLYADGNVSTFVNICNELVGNEDIKIIPDQLDTSTYATSHITNIEQVKQKYRCLDVQYMLPFYQANAESKMIQFEDMRDDATINMINSKYFEKNPIDFGKL